VALTLVQAQAHLDAWLAADLACAAGQSYTIGSRSLTRADGKLIATNIEKWQAKVDQLAAGRTAAVRTTRIIPRDL